MAKIVVYHTTYDGCDTGCCGHAIEVGDRYHFEFSHPDYGQSARAFAEELVTDELGPEHVADLDWDNCVISEW